MKWKSCMRLAAGVAVLVFAASSQAWELECLTDRFTEEVSCSIQHFHRDDEGTVLLMIGLSDDGKRLGFVAGDGETRYTESFLVRVDRLPVRDLGEDGLSIHGQQGRVTSLLEPDYGIATVGEMVKGEQVSIRLRASDGERQDWNIDPTGLESVWKEFRERTGF